MVVKKSIQPWQLVQRADNSRPITLHGFEQCLLGFDGFPVYVKTKNMKYCSASLNNGIETRGVYEIMHEFQIRDYGGF